MDDFLFLLFYLGALQVNLFYVKMDWEVEYKKSVEIKDGREIQAGYFQQKPKCVTLS